ncbi:zinc ribbon domain-containing protein [bacterium]|nr:zinc ribbon domain-containing protein [bacterium]
MPIYEYRCSSCEEQFEKLVYGSNPELECPKCKSKDVSRLLSLFGFSSGGEFTSSNGKNSGCDTCHATSCASCH